MDSFRIIPIINNFLNPFVNRCIFAFLLPFPYSLWCLRGWNGLAMWGEKTDPVFSVGIRKVVRIL